MNENTVFLMGKAYRVPAGLTIMKAMEYAGYRLLRGCGCRGGYCGACATVYRLPGDYRLHADLACQTTVVEGMTMAQLPFTPAEHPVYALAELRPTGQTLTALFPELARCVACNTCTKACPQQLEVMDAVQAALRGDIPRVAEMAFDCVQCGLCAMRCPAEISHYYVWQLARRLHGAYLAPPDEQLAARVAQVEECAFAAELDALTAMEHADLVQVYQSRDIES